MRNRDHRPTLLTLMAALALALAGANGALAAADKVTICHFPPSSPENAQVIDVNATAVDGHVANHNDAVCPADATDCCYGGADPSVCTDFQTDPDNCSGCGAVCTVPNATAACEGGLCAVGSCDPGYADCNVDPADGCELPVSDDPANCGGCGVTCAAGEICLDGSCTASPVPECAGETCATFTGCNPASCAGNGVCGSTAEGGGACVDGSLGCASLVTCASSAECAPGELCIVDSCCGVGVCVGPANFCW